jgi:hypothetical protein
VLQPIATVTLVLIVALTTATLAGAWRMFAKAGRHGWEVLIPLYDFIVMCEIAGQPTWIVVLLFVPMVAPVVWIVVCAELAARYGRSKAFGLLLAVAPFVVAPILGFGSAVYTPPPATVRGPMATPEVGLPSPASPLTDGPRSRNAKVAMILGVLSILALVAGLVAVGAIEASSSDSPTAPPVLPDALSFTILPGAGWALGLAALWFGVAGLRDVRSLAPGTATRGSAQTQSVTGIALAAAAYYMVFLMFIGLAYG